MAKQKTIIGIDWGERRCGVARAVGNVVLPVGTVASDRLLSFLQEQVSEQDVEAFVVGIPYNTDGSPTHATAGALRLIARLQNTFPHIKVYQVDERFTTAQAHRMLLAHRMPRQKQKQVVDQLSAMLILETFLMQAKTANKTDMND